MIPPFPPSCEARGTCLPVGRGEVGDFHNFDFYYEGLL
jgi:hypothetical protein